MSQSPKILKRSDWLEQATSIVQSGGVVALPFERLFGLAANAFSEEALDRIRAIKVRSNLPDSRQPISVIVPDLKNVDLVSEISHLNSPRISPKKPRSDTGVLNKDRIGNNFR